MTDSMITVIYTLTPTHCGTGQATGAIDLPIAREVHTGLPVIPASSLKGALAARKTWNEGDEHARYFGFAAASDDEGQKNGGEKKSPESSAGSIVFMEGRLVLYPVRSLQRPFLYVTCPLILERLDRDARALEIASELGEKWAPLIALLKESRGALKDAAWVSSKGLAGQTLVLEDLVYTGQEVKEQSGLQAVAEFLAARLPKDEAATVELLEENLVLLGNEAFLELVNRAVPVQARIRLDRATKTTSNGDGNLWYEEHLPADCVFVSLITTRHGLFENRASVLRSFEKKFADKKVIQLGGNETVGQGLCFWSGKAVAQ